MMELIANDHGRHPPLSSSISISLVIENEFKSRNDAVDFQKSIPFTLSFNNLTYTVKVPRKDNLFPGAGQPDDDKLALFSKTERTILNNVSGEAHNGEILAVLGASGSGKSTLLDALANRIEKSSLEGTLTLNDEVLESRTLKVISAYVMQGDLLFPMLTVEETLMYSAEFRLPRLLSKPKKMARVQALIDQLGLRKAANTVIGDEGHRGISGGERRRVSIGIDIIHDPIILFLDEPTSGLDSTSAFMVVNVLKTIARNGSVVIMTMHQPSYRILGLLDRLLFLSGGEAVYSGTPAGLPSFFSGFGYPIPENENWAEFGLDLVRELELSPGGTKQLVEYNRIWQAENPEVQEKKALLTLKEAMAASFSRGKLVTGGGQMASTFANPVWSEMGVLWRRSMSNSWRMPELVGVRFGVVLLSGFLLGTIFWNLDDSPKGVGERLGFFGFALSTTFYTSADALPVFVQERYIFIRETAYNSYRRSSYVLTYALLALPSLVLLSLGFAAMTFWTVGLSGGLPGFSYYFLIILASFYAGNSFVTFVSGIVPHVMLGYVVVIATLAYHILFSGFFISSDRIPPYWIWFNYLSLVKYPYEGILQNEFHDPTKCFVRGVQIFDSTALGDLPSAAKLTLLKSMGEVLGGDINGSMCWTTGRDVLEEQGVIELNKWNCLLVTMAWAIFFRVCFYFSLLLGSKNKRK